MTDVAHAVALVLAGVFIWAATAKLLDPRAASESFAALHVPAPRAAARAVPALELALAAGLVARPALAGWAAAAVLATFTAVLARAVARGADVPCACFGGARREPVSSVELVRNAMLAAAAIVATAGGGDALWPSLPALVIATVAFGLGRVLLGLADLRHAGARIWATPLPGSTTGDRRSEA